MDAFDNTDDDVNAALPAPVSAQPHPTTAEPSPPTPHSGGIYIYDPATGTTVPMPAGNTAKE